MSENVGTAWENWLRGHAWEAGKERRLILFPANVYPLFVAFYSLQRAREVMEGDGTPEQLMESLNAMLRNEFAA